MENETVDIEEISGDVLMYVMKRFTSKIKGKQFIETSIEIFTLCLSEIIKAGYCRSHYQNALEKCIEKMIEDLQLNTESTEDF